MRLGSRTAIETVERWGLLRSAAGRRSLKFIFLLFYLAPTKQIRFICSCKQKSSSSGLWECQRQERPRYHFLIPPMRSHLFIAIETLGGEFFFSWKIICLCLQTRPGIWSPILSLFWGMVPRGRQEKSWRELFSGRKVESTLQSWNSRRGYKVWESSSFKANIVLG